MIIPLKKIVNHDPSLETSGWNPIDAMGQNHLVKLEFQIQYGPFLW
jgi:hypothetical protein